MSSHHRLHYRWSQLEAERSGLCIGSPLRPLPAADRVLHLRSGHVYSDWPAAWDDPTERKRFSACAGVYKSSEYNTFCRDGWLKLTEVELYFLSSMMTRTSSSEWVVVYLGAGNGCRFRYLRDEFFPALTVIAFNQLSGTTCDGDENQMDDAHCFRHDENNFIFHARCFNVDDDVVLIHETRKGKKLLLISDTRSAESSTDARHLYSASDQELQWRAIQLLRPDHSLVKFLVPEMISQFYDYAPGVLLKQVFCFYGSREMRLIVDGVPQQRHRYNSWEVYEKMATHHKHLRGLVYETTKPHDCTACFDSCFDCSVLWKTLSTYAFQNNLDANEIARKLVKNHVVPAWSWGEFESVLARKSPRWRNVEFFLKSGCLTQAIASLQDDIESNEDDNDDWAEIAECLNKDQPNLAQRLKSSLLRPASREVLIQQLSSLAQPFTFIKTEYRYS